MMNKSDLVFQKDGTPVCWGRKTGQLQKDAHSFNGRTAASGAAYWGSNPWWAAKIHTFTIFVEPCHTSNKQYNSMILIQIPSNVCALRFVGVRF